MPPVDGIRSTAGCCACKTWYHNLIVKPSKLLIQTATLPAFTAWLPVLSSRVKAAFTCSVQGALRWDESNPKNYPLYKLRTKPWDGFSRIGPWMNYGIAFPVHISGEESTCTMNHLEKSLCTAILELLDVCASFWNCHEKDWKSSCFEQAWHGPIIPITGKTLKRFRQSLKVPLAFASTCLNMSCRRTLVPC